MSVVLHLLWACSGGGLDTGVTCADGELLDGAQCVPEACGTGTWGDLEADVWVDGDAEEGGDGSQEAPFRTLAEALAEDTRVGVAAGT